MGKKELGKWLITHGYVNKKNDEYVKEGVRFVLYEDFINIWFDEANLIVCAYTDLRFNNDIMYVEFAFV